ncbi:PadR family transcriptional regulator [Pokkaliibacter plantistimulans]|uniref:PadR family transcriptional regulator n=2 Tax=Pseudomonadota TaxID=1224 RepID=A0A2S5KHK5_9PROT|nr:PadR family transcriptional regulator [Pokkaliibacter plantistimulans]
MKVRNMRFHQGMHDGRMGRGAGRGMGRAMEPVFIAAQGMAADMPVTGGRRGRGGRSGKRIFANGGMRLILLALIDRQPSYGYELIKAIETACAGAYIPSPGVLYPTLSLLEDQQLIEQADDASGARKIYRITPAGQTELTAQRDWVDLLFAQLSSVNVATPTSSFDKIVTQMRSLKAMLRGRLVSQSVSTAQVDQVSEVLQQAGEQIRQILVSSPAQAPATTAQGQQGEKA